LVAFFVQKKASLTQALFIFIIEGKTGMNSSYAYHDRYYYF